MGTQKWLGVVVVVVLALSACGVADTGDTTMTTTGATSSTNPTTTTSSLPTAASPDTTTSTSTTIPGEIIDFGPRMGDVLMVVGVRYDDVLNLRAFPGPDQPILATLSPDLMDLIALGETRQIPNAFWIAVSSEGIEGWVNLRYVGYEGVTEDLTASVVDDLGEYPTASSMTDLGVIVAESMASEEPESDVVLVEEETIGDLGEVTYDVIGLGDDAVLGLRVHVFGEPVSDGFSLKSVEVTVICGRGIGADGLCP